MDIKELRDRLRAEETFDYYFFWKGPFSQWYKSPIIIDGVSYTTAEHWMMCEKARLFGDEDVVEKILSDPSPRAAKAFGRQVKNYDDAMWSAKRVYEVVVGNMAKFSQDQRLKEMLLETKNMILVEASPEDRIWGIGLHEEDPRSRSPEHWPGINLLGFALMEVRERLRKDFT